MVSCLNYGQPIERDEESIPSQGRSHHDDPARVCTQSTTTACTGRSPDQPTNQGIIATLTLGGYVRSIIICTCMQDLPPSSVNRSAEGRPVVASEGGLFHKLEPYLTTNHRCHRYFPPEECSGYPRKDVATYWICENYPKVCACITE